LTRGENKEFNQYTQYKWTNMVEVSPDKETLSDFKPLFSNQVGDLHTTVASFKP